MEPLEHQFHLMVIFWISDGHFPISLRNENTDIKHRLICLWHDQLMALQYWRPVIQGFWVTSLQLFFSFKAFLYMLLE